MGVNVKVDLSVIDDIRREVDRSVSLRKRIANAWSTIYRSFVRKRFYEQSRGGGEWPPLAQSTIARRRGGGGGAAILRDTGALLASLQPELNQGGLMQTTPLQGIGFRAELSGNGTYASGPTLSEIASYHHHGEGNLPKREILVQPDGQTVQNMVDHAERIMTNHLNGS